jgi:hypothetical protein
MGKDATRINVNRALRRRSKAFGISRDIAIVLGLIVVFCMLLLYLEVPINLVTAIFTTLFITTLFILKDGMGEVLAKLRKPRYYTRGCLDYRSPLTRRKINEKAKKSQKE